LKLEAEGFDDELPFDLLIAPEGIEMCMSNKYYSRLNTLLIAPEGIEITYKLVNFIIYQLLLIAPEGIEI